MITLSHTRTLRLSCLFLSFWLLLFFCWLGDLWASNSPTSTGYARVIVEGTCNNTFLILLNAKNTVTVYSSLQLSFLIVNGPFSCLITFHHEHLFQDDVCSCCFLIHSIVSSVNFLLLKKMKEVIVSWFLIQLCQK